MNLILSDGKHKTALLPFTYTRPVADIRIGILTIREKWEKYLGITGSTLTDGYLSKKWPLKQESVNLVVNASFLPNKELTDFLQNLQMGEAVVTPDGEPIAYVTTDATSDFEKAEYTCQVFEGEILTVRHPWDIFAKNKEALEADFELLTKDRQSQPIPEGNTVIAPENVFIEEGASVSCAIINAFTGPVYIGKNAKILEGCIIRGPLALCDHAILKMGAKIYGPSTFGPYCKAGGEVNNSVLFAYSNKGHEGFLGNSVLGEWCNIGADTNTSNLKNNYAEVRLWDYETEGFAKTGLQFCGLMMGDHAKAGINTMFNTGTVVGVSANVFGSGFPRNFIPSFSWGGASGFTTYRTVKAFETAKAMMARRKVDFDEIEQAILAHVFEMTKKWRKE